MTVKLARTTLAHPLIQRRSSRFVALSLLLATLLSCAAQRSSEQRNDQTPHLRGWDFVVNYLEKQGLDRDTVRAVYTDPRMPERDFITFRLDPKEPLHLYASFGAEEQLREVREFMREHAPIFHSAQERYRVDPAVVASILFIETRFGKAPGTELVINRLSRLVGLSDPTNIQRNFERLKKENGAVSFEQVAARAKYLEEQFGPELPALFQIARQEKLDLFELRGSYAGAFGIPQFLPTSLLRFGVDGNGDQRISLFDIADAIHSTAHYLSANGWRNDLTLPEKRGVIWRYNRSQGYIDAVLRMASKLSPKGSLNNSVSKSTR